MEFVVIFKSFGYSSSVRTRKTRRMHLKQYIYPFFTIVFALCLCVLTLSNTAHAKTNPRYASIVMDADTGLILHQRYADKKLHPASLTKAMTLIMLFDAVEHGRLRLNDRIPISRHAASMVPSKLNLPPGSTIKVKDAISALVTKSANDVAAAIAEKLGGSERNFARLMTAKARAMGMTSTTFKNASGLHNPGQITTARDMAKMAQIMIRDYPEQYRYFSMKSFTYKGHTYRNHNRLMDTYKGMDGLKTGYVNASGFNLVASAVRNNRRIIGVVFGGRTSKSRNAHMAALLDQGFTKINNIRVASMKAPLPPRKPGILVALNKITPINRAASNNSKWATLNPALKNGMIGQMIGQGDFDPAAARRFETGLMAIAAHKGQYNIGADPTPVKKAALQPRAAGNTPWAIQIGAFTSRAATDQAIQATLKTLPTAYKQANAIIAPLRTKNGWLFRGRLSGFTQPEAYAACRYLKECLPVAPYN